MLGRGVMLLWADTGLSHYHLKSGNRIHDRAGFDGSTGSGYELRGDLLCLRAIKGRDGAYPIKHCSPFSERCHP